MIENQIRHVVQSRLQRLIRRHHVRMRQRLGQRQVAVAQAAQFFLGHFLLPPADHVDGRVLELPSYDEVSPPTPEGKAAYARAAHAFHYETNPFNARPLLQRSR